MTYFFLAIKRFSAVILLISAAIGHRAVGDEELAYKATNPIASLSQLQYEDDYTPANYGSRDDSNVFMFKPIYDIEKTSFFPFEQLIRAKIRIETTPKTSSKSKTTGLEDTQLFDLLVLAQGDWGRWGLGPIFVFPTATKVATGQGKWQLGPALGISLRAIPKWQFVFLFQNPISFAGDRHRPAVNTLYFQPTVTRHFDDGWYISSDGEWTIEWRTHAITIPVNLGIGRVFKLGDVDLNVGTVGEWTVYHHNNTTTPHFTFKLEFNLLFPK